MVYLCNVFFVSKLINESNSQVKVPISKVQKEIETDKFIPTGDPLVIEHPVTASLLESTVDAIYQYVAIKIDETNASLSRQFEALDNKIENNFRIYSKQFKNIEQKNSLFIDNVESTIKSVELALESNKEKTNSNWPLEFSAEKGISSLTEKVSEFEEFVQRVQKSLDLLNQRVQKVEECDEILVKTVQNFTLEASKIPINVVNGDGDTTELVSSDEKIL